MFTVSKYSSISHIVTDYAGIVEQPEKDNYVKIIESVFYEPVNIDKCPLDIICKIASFLRVKEVTYLTCLSTRNLISNPDHKSAPLLIEKSRLLGLQFFLSTQELLEAALYRTISMDKIIVVMHLSREGFNISPNCLGSTLHGLMMGGYWREALDLVSCREDMPPCVAEHLLWHKCLPASLKAELLKMPKYQLLYTVKCEGLSDVSNILDSFPNISSGWVATALIHATDQGNREKVLVLLQKRKDISMTGIGIALEQAISKHDKTIALDLLNATNYCSEPHCIAFKTAAGLGQLEVVTAFIPKIDNSLLIAGIKAAVRKGKLEIVRYLISLNRHDAQELESAIEVAALYRDAEIAEFLKGQRELTEPEIE